MGVTDADNEDTTADFEVDTCDELRDPTKAMSVFKPRVDRHNNILAQRLAGRRSGGRTAAPYDTPRRLGNRLAIFARLTCHHHVRGDEDRTCEALKRRPRDELGPHQDDEPDAR